MKISGVITVYEIPISVQAVLHIRCTACLRPRKIFAVFYVFRMSIYLIHQPILFAVLLHRPAGNFLDKPHNVLRIGGCLCHEFVLDLRHAVCGRLDYQLVKIFEINIKRSGCTATFFCKGFDPGAGKTVFSITFKSFFRDFLLSFAVLLFCLHF